LEIRISDNGVGFDVEATPRGLGMVGIYVRVEVMNGIVELQSEPSIGTQYVVTVPLGRVPVRDD
jgi:signal transduction histidine kinase